MSNHKKIWRKMVMTGKAVEVKVKVGCRTGSILYHNFEGSSKCVDEQNGDILNQADTPYDIAFHAEPLDSSVYSVRFADGKKEGPAVLAGKALASNPRCVTGHDFGKFGAPVSYGDGYKLTNNMQASNAKLAYKLNLVVKIKKDGDDIPWPIDPRIINRVRLDTPKKKVAKKPAAKKTRGKSTAKKRS